MVWEKTLVNEFDFKDLLPHLKELKETEGSIWGAHYSNNIDRFLEIVKSRHEKVSNLTKIILDEIESGLEAGAELKHFPKYDKIMEMLNEITIILENQAKQFAEEENLLNRDKREIIMSKDDMPDLGHTQIYHKIDVIEKIIEQGAELIIKISKRIEDTIK